MTLRASISAVPQDVLSTFAMPVVRTSWGAPPLGGVTAKVHSPPSSNTPVTNPPTMRPPVEGSTAASDTCADAPLRVGTERGEDGCPVLPGSTEGAGDGEFGVADGLADGVA